MTSGAMRSRPGWPTSMPGGSAKGFAEVARGRKVGEARELAEPVWIAAFLGALGVTGNVAASAEIAGVDVTGVYRRKTRNAEFRAQWGAVLRARAVRASGVAAPAEMGLEPRTSASGVKMARAGKRRWSAKAEAQFLAALANGADVPHAAEAAGFCQATVIGQRAKDARFAAVWLDAMVAGQAVVQAGLIAQAARDYDADNGADRGAPNVPPMTVTERMAVAKLPLGNGGASVSGGGGWFKPGSPQALEAMRMSLRESAELKIKLLEKIWRVRLQLVEKRRREGGLEVGRLVLEPGWVWQGKGPMPALPGQDDDQGWDRLGEAIKAWRERWKRGEEVPFALD